MTPGPDFGAASSVAGVAPLGGQRAPPSGLRHGGRLDGPAVAAVADVRAAVEQNHVVAATAAELVVQRGPEQPVRCCAALLQQEVRAAGSVAVCRRAGGVTIRRVSGRTVGPLGTTVPAVAAVMSARVGRRHIHGWSPPQQLARKDGRLLYVSGGSGELVHGRHESDQGAAPCQRWRGRVALPRHAVSTARAAHQDGVVPRGVAHEHVCTRTVRTTQVSCAGREGHQAPVLGDRRRVRVGEARRPVHTVRAAHERRLVRRHLPHEDVQHRRCGDALVSEVGGAAS